VRLDALLSRFGYCSRSEARSWIKDGRVKVAGQLATNSSQKAEPRSVTVDDSPVEFPDGILVALHKPAGFVCSHDTNEGPTVYDLLPPRWSQRNPPVTTVGRLDKDATGLLLITDDGAIVHRWTSPKHKVAKVYEVHVDHDLPANIAEVFASGTLLLEGETKACLPGKVEVLGPRHARLEITEGRYHQVKRMFASQGCTVLRLHRISFGQLTLGDLRESEWRTINQSEVHPG
jgi:16S rRNA pseudouridine516 synthase